MARHPDDKWNDEDYKTRGDGYEMNSVRLHDLNLHLTIGANGQVLVIKHRTARGLSETLYKWNGPQPQLPEKRTVN